MANVGSIQASISVDGLAQVSDDLKSLGSAMDSTSKQVSGVGKTLASSTKNIDSFGRAFNNQFQSMEAIESKISDVTTKIDEFKNSTMFADQEASKAYVEANDKLKGLQMEYSLLNSATRKFGSETALAMVDAMKPMIPLQAKSRELQGEWYKMGFNTAQFNGDADSMMKSIQSLGKEQKKLNDEMMKVNEMGKVAFMQQAGAMLNLSTQASKISDAFTKQGTALEKMSKPALSAVDSMNKFANAGNASVLALKQLGPNANMKDLQDRIGMINQGLMRTSMVALAGGIASAMLYGSMHKQAMESDAQYKELFETLKKVWKEALQPMVQVFADVGKAVMPVLIAIGEMVIAFNEANPVLSKIIAGFLLLIPALVLILSPLAIGIGMFAGLQATFSMIWMLLGPLITGLGAISGPVLLIAGAIAVAVAIGVALYKNWDEIIAFGKKMWDGFATFFVNLWEKLKQAVSAYIDFVLSVYSAIWDKLTVVFTAFIDFSKGLWTSLMDKAKEIFDGIVAFGTAFFDILKNVFLIGVGILLTLIAPIYNFYVEIFNNIVTFVSGIFVKLSEYFTAYVKWASDNLAKVKAKFLEIYNYIRDNIVAPVINKIKEIIGSLTAKVTEILGAIKQAFLTAWTYVYVNIVKPYIDKIKQIVTTLATKATEIAGKVKSAFTSGFDKMVSGAKTAVEKVKGFFTGIWDKAKEIAGRVKDAFSGIFKGIKVPSFSLGGWKPSDLPSLPKMSVQWNAKGGILNSSTLIGAGEKGTESIVPLSSQRRMKPFAQAVSKFMGEDKDTAGNVAININKMEVRSEDDIRKVSQELYRLMQRDRKGGGRV